MPNTVIFELSNQLLEQLVVAYRNVWLIYVGFV
jgi:hypothetical protein